MSSQTKTGSNHPHCPWAEIARKHCSSSACVIACTKLARAVTGTKEQIPQGGDSYPALRHNILGYIDDKIIPLPFNEIAFFYASQKGIKAYTASGSTPRIKGTLENLQQKLCSSAFFRANRQFLINRNLIDYVEFYFNRRLLVKMTIKAPEPLIISKERSNSFFQWLEQ